MGDSSIILLDSNPLHEVEILNKARSESAVMTAVWFGVKIVYYYSCHSKSMCVCNASIYMIWIDILLLSYWHGRKRWNWIERRKAFWLFEWILWLLACLLACLLDWLYCMVACNIAGFYLKKIRDCWKLIYPIGVPQLYLLFIFMKSND